MSLTSIESLPRGLPGQLKSWLEMHEDIYWMLTSQTCIKVFGLSQRQAWQLDRIFVTAIHKGTWNMCEYAAMAGRRWSFDAQAVP